MKKIAENIIKWGIVGVGDVCEVKSAPAMQLIEHSELVAVMRRNGAKAKDYAERHGVPKWYDDADQLINDPEINAIYVATPPNAHAAYVVKAANAGKPVYVEKPMARNVAECQQMVDACEAAKIPLYVAYYRRQMPNFEYLKALVEDGAIGEVRLIRIELFKTVNPDIVANSPSENWRINPEVAGGGYFFDLAAHQLDYWDYLLGPIAEVQGFAGNQAGLYPAADILAGSFRFESGVLGSGTWCFTTDEAAAKDEMIIIGSQGKITISFFGAPKILLERSGQEPEVFEFELPKHIQQPLIQTVTNDLLGTGECPSTGKSAIRTNWVMEELTKAYYQ